MRNILVGIFVFFSFNTIAQQDSLQYSHLVYLFEQKAYQEAFEIMDSPLWNLDSVEKINFNFYSVIICKELYKGNKQLNSNYLNRAILLSDSLLNTNDTALIRVISPTKIYLTTEIYNHLAKFITRAGNHSDSLNFRSITNETLLSFSKFDFHALDHAELEYMAKVFYNEAVIEIMALKIEGVAFLEIESMQQRAMHLFRICYLCFEELCAREPSFCKMKETVGVLFKKG